jgi:hypothetical protein
MPWGWGQHLGEIMGDDQLIEESLSLQTLYCDGLGAFRKINGVLRCIGYVIQGGANLNLVLSLDGAERALNEIQRALRGQPANGLAFWNGYDLSRH